MSTTTNMQTPSLEARRTLMNKMARESSELEPFYIIDLGDVLRKYHRWVKALPRVKPFYAVKCNNNDRILDTLVAAGTGFDCASKAEMEAMVSRGVEPARLIYAHPCKPVPHLQYAKKVGVEMMTFDNVDELVKIKTHYPQAKLVLRILVDDSYAVCRLGTKFGVTPAGAAALLDAALGLGLTVIGISFHVGSGCTNAKAFSSAVASIAPAFAHGRALGFPMTLLDVGGGFPGQPDAPVRFEDIAVELTRALDQHFPAAAPENATLTIIAEPGRYFVASACSLAVNITAKRTTPLDDGAQHHDYYVNDGVYGSFNCTLFDHQVCVPQVLVATGNRADAACATTLWGPTCDSMDCITRTHPLPEVDVGDWLVFDNMGAYTMAASSTFNGFARPNMHYIFTTARAARVLPDSPPDSPRAVSDDEGNASSDDEDAVDCRRRSITFSAEFWAHVTPVTVA